MSLSRRTPAKEPKPRAPAARDAFGRRVIDFDWVRPYAEAAYEVEVAEMAEAPIERLAPLRKATMTAKPRPVVPVLKTVYDLPDAERKRLWGHVASLPCQYRGCGKHGVQVAHLSLLEFGKGRGLKVPDAYVAALCDEHHLFVDSSNSAEWPERLEELLYAGYRTVCELLMRGLIRPL